MAFYIEKMIFHNRAPFKHLELNFKDKDIILLNAVNGGGKQRYYLISQMLFMN